VLDEGNGARQILGDPKGAVKTIVIGVVDYIETESVLRYDHRRSERSFGERSERSPA